jgi:2-polyprenyl-3-methyl-5-hydroxy-6-metoxy-1,4-benzoquinol methylase
LNPEIFENYLQLDREHFWRVAKRLLVLQFIENHHPRPKQLKILDVGSGTSQIMLDLQRYGEVTAVEPLEEAIRLTRERLEVNMVKGSLPSALPHGSYDLVTVLDVLEHVEG